MKNYLTIALALILSFSITSCGVLFYGAKQKVQVNSTPAGAKIFVNGEYTGQTTPAEVLVTRRVKDGPTSTKQKMTYKLVKEGYSDYTQLDDSKFNVASFIGSALLGGLIGIGIDAGVGVNRSYPKVVNANLSVGSSSSSSGLLIDRASEVPPAGYNETTESTTTPPAATNEAPSTTKSTDNKFVGSVNISTPSTNETAGTVNITTPSENNTTSTNESTAGTVKITAPHTESTAGTVNISTPATSAGTVNISTPTNLRESIWQEMKKTDYASANTNTSISLSQSETVVETAGSTKLKKTEENAEAKDLKYRRSSLYTLMINDPDREFANVIYDAFGNAVIPSKFNDHNIGPYLIDGSGGVKKENKQADHITEYLVNNKVANSLIAKWFNRDTEGKFNMDLIAERGMYDASALDAHIAGQSERGTAMLADAGEELIEKTFVIVNDYKYTNKEEIAAKTNKGLGILKDVAAVAGYDVSAATDLAAAGATIAGKGYVVKTTSYLYQLVWDEEASATFYYSYWIDVNNYDPAKVEAFNNANNFKLKLVGYQSAWADVQSSIFSNKENDDLIKMATIKATDKAMAKLAVKYEEFRTKTPLFSTEPLAAKIGTKEGLEKGDKFEVLEQVLTEEGKTEYKRKGIIKVDQVWDNSITEEEMEELKRQGKLPEIQYTTFKGSGNYYPGMLIKQTK